MVIVFANNLARVIVAAAAVKEAHTSAGCQINQELLDRVMRSFEQDDTRRVIEETARAVVERMKEGA